MIKIDKDLCIGCGACTGVCPSGSLELDAEGKCSCKNETCIQCLACVSTCPVGAIADEEDAPQEEKKEDNLADNIYAQVKDLEYKEFTTLIHDLIEKWAKDNDYDYSDVEQSLM